MPSLEPFQRRKRSRLPALFARVFVAFVASASAMVASTLCGGDLASCRARLEAWAASVTRTHFLMASALALRSTSSCEPAVRLRFTARSKHAGTS